MPRSCGAFFFEPFLHQPCSDRMKFVFAILICLAVGGIAGMVTSSEVTGPWFTTIQKPSFQPPNWLFAPVWTTLYVLMGIALGIVWRQPASAQRNAAVTLFFVQLLFNFLWSYIFFSWHMPGLALIDIITLWICIILTIFAFARHSRLAAWLIVPYVSWVSFASILNWSIWHLNP